jgi:hypothetical protein
MRKIIEKYKIIDNILYPSFQEIAITGLLLPSLTALTYIFLYPYPSKLTYSFYKKRQKEISDIKKQIDDEVLLTQKESRVIKGEIYLLEGEYNREVERKDEEIKRLSQKLKRSPKTETDQVKNFQLGKTPSLSKHQRNILPELSKSQHPLSESSLISNYSDEHVAEKHALDELHDRKYVSGHYSEAAKRREYELTRDGRAYVVKNRIV